MDEQERPRSALEQHIQTVIAAVLLALLLWNGNALVDLRDKVGRFEERLLTLQSQVNASTSTHFSVSEWRREKEVIDDRFQRLERLVEKISHTSSR
jgi:hypothetical protein